MEIDSLQTEGSRLVKTSDPVTHLQKSVREAFHALSGSVEAQPLLSQLELAFTGLLSTLRRPHCRPRTQATTISTWPYQQRCCPGPTRAHWRDSPRTSVRPRSRSSWRSSKKSAGFGHLKRHLNTTYCACSWQAATGEGPSLSFLAKILVGEGSSVPESHQKNNLYNYHGERHSVEIWTVDARHNSSQ